MGRTVRSREIAAAPQAVWRLVSDPHHLPRWWPDAARVEDVGGDHFTLVMPTKRGKPMRLDQRVTENKAPLRRAWSQELPGTPFERLLVSWDTSVVLEPRTAGTHVTIEENQQLRGSFRLGALLQRRPARKRLDRALARLAELLE